jgi:hypothetical protein
MSSRLDSGQGGSAIKAKRLGVVLEDLHAFLVYVVIGGRYEMNRP